MLNRCVRTEYINSGATVKKKIRLQIRLRNIEGGGEGARGKIGEGSDAKKKKKLLKKIF